MLGVDRTDLGREVGETGRGTGWLRGRGWGREIWGWRSTGERGWLQGRGCPFFRQKNHPGQVSTRPHSIFTHRSPSHPLPHPLTLPCYPLIPSHSHRYPFSSSPVVPPSPPLLSDAAVTGAALLARSRTPHAPMVRGSLLLQTLSPRPPRATCSPLPLHLRQDFLPGRHHAVRADRGLRPAARRLTPPPARRARQKLAGLFRVNLFTSPRVDEATSSSTKDARLGEPSRIARAKMLRSRAWKKQSNPLKPRTRPRICSQ